MERHTHRQFLTWMVWLDEEWNSPSRTDHYLMQVACEARRAVMKNPQRARIADFKLEFSSSEQPSAALSQDQAALAKSVWLSRMTMDPVQAEEAPEG